MYFYYLTLPKFINAVVSEFDILFFIINKNKDH